MSLIANFIAGFVAGFFAGIVIGVIALVVVGRKWSQGLVDLGERTSAVGARMPNTKRVH